MSEHEEVDWEPILPFDADDPGYSRAFSLGAVYALSMTTLERPWVVLVHPDCAEMLARIRLLFGDPPRFVVEDQDEWLMVTFLSVPS